MTANQNTLPFPTTTATVGHVSYWTALAALLFLWGIVIAFINPAGEFMINDDWCFVQIVETILAGEEVTATGWGDGGPAVFCHILWGVIFSKLFGFSVTVLRFSVLALGIGSSLIFFLLLCSVTTSRWLPILATLALIFNPLFFSQSFTYMSDITFFFLFITSFFLLHTGIRSSGQGYMIMGLFFALLAILTRQIGLVLPLGLLLTVLLHPHGKNVNRTRLFVLIIAITILPWLLYEIFLWQAGSTPVTSHPVFKRIFSSPMDKGVLDYPLYLLGQLGVIALYTGFLASPLIICFRRQLLASPLYRKVSILLGISFVFFESALLTGTINPPSSFYKNIIYNFGLGPLLLKDAYLLDIQRTVSLPKPLFFLLAFIALLGALALLLLIAQSLGRLFRPRRQTRQDRNSFTACCALICACIYCGVILLTGFHDRYLIPVCALLLIWLAWELEQAAAHIKGPPLALSTLPLLFLAWFSVFGVKDFFSYKQSLHQAHRYLLKQEIHPCDTDGGFEFNGYHCSAINTLDYNREDYSWWWVAKETYLVTLGPLPGYQVMKTFPFSRYIGNDGAVHILQPDKYQDTNR